MQIFLIESGGFVGVPLRYEVDVSALDDRVLQALERALATPTAKQQPESTSAGELSIRLIRDDGSVNELTMSQAAPEKDVAQLAERLRACAKIVRDR